MVLQAPDRRRFIAAQHRTAPSAPTFAAACGVQVGSTLGKTHWFARPGARWCCRVWRVLKWLIALIVIVVVAVGAAVGLATYDELTATLPPIDRLLEYDPPVATRVYADDGALIEEFFRERRYRVPIEDIPPTVRNAFLAAEDSDFFAHRGVDFFGIARAAFANFRAGDVVQGASTITQQVVKALLLTPERSYERKLKEILLSLRLEQSLSKNQILELYLNQIYLGDGNHGVGAAARNYFGKSVQELTPAQAALLAGLPAAPSRYSPNRSPVAARQRQHYVLRRMLEENFLTAGEYQTALAEPIVLVTRREKPHAVRNYYTEAVRLQLEDMFGAEAPYNQGYEVHTAMQPRLQALAQVAVRNGIERIDLALGYRGPLKQLSAEERQRQIAANAGQMDADTLDPDRLYEAVVTAVTPGRVDITVGPWNTSVDVKSLHWYYKVKNRKFAVGDVLEVRARQTAKAVVSPPPLELAEGQSPTFHLSQTPEVEAAMVVIDIDRGGVAAMVGGYNFLGSQFNRAFQALRQPGSAFKPFIYAAALDHGFTPASILQDSPVEYWDHDKMWQPRNYTRDYKGAIRLRTALEQSRNVVSVKLVDSVGVKTVVDYLSRFHFDSKFGPNLSLGLGTTEVTLRDLTEAYTTFANGGVKVEPVLIRSISDKDGTAFFSDEPRRREALSPQTAALMTHILQGVVQRGTATSIKALGRPVAGKTGTTNEQRDAWFMGYTPNLAVGVWVGFDDPNRTMGKMGTGGRVAAPIWLDFMQPALEGLPVRDFDIPEDINCVNIDPYSGKRAGEWTAKPFLECFRAGSEPGVPVAEVVPDAGPVEGNPLWPPSTPFGNAPAAGTPPGGAPPTAGSPGANGYAPPSEAPPNNDPRWGQERNAEQPTGDRWGPSGVPAPRIRAEAVPTDSGTEVRLYRDAAPTPREAWTPPVAPPPAPTDTPPAPRERLWDDQPIEISPPTTAEGSRVFPNAPQGRRE